MRFCLREIFKSSYKKAALRPLTQIPFPWRDSNRIYYTTGAKKSTVKRHGFAEIFHADSKKGAYFRLHAFIMYLQWGDTLPAMRVFTAYFTMKRPFRAARRTRARRCAAPQGSYARAPATFRTKEPYARIPFPVPRSADSGYFQACAP